MKGEPRLLTFIKDITLRKQAWEKVRESEEQFRKIFDDAGIGMVMTDMETNILRANDEFCLMLGYTKEELEGRHLAELGHPDDISRDTITFRNLINGMKDKVLMEKRFLHKDGHTVWTILAGIVLTDKDGMPRYAVGQIQNITKRKEMEEQIRKSLEEKEVLLREIHHRVKNNMQTISSLLTLQGAQEKDDRIDRILAESKARLETMAMIHEMLYRSESLAEIELESYLRALVEKLQTALVPDDGRIVLKIESENIVLFPNQAVPCALAVTELLSNCIEHGFPDGRSGEIFIEANLSEDDYVQIVVSDNGIGFTDEAEAPNKQSLGLQLVNSLVSDQLKGRFEKDRSSGGTRSVIKFKRTPYSESN
jgi:PAS domain S-box-containing protein